MVIGTIREDEDTNDDDAVGFGSPVLAPPGGGGGRGAGVRVTTVTHTGSASGAMIFDNLPAELTAAGNRRSANEHNNDNDAAGTDDELDGGSDENNSAGNFSAGQFSVDTTQIASSVGSVVRASREAFLRSVTFMRDQPHDLVWDLAFADPVQQKYKRSLSGTLRDAFSRRRSSGDNIDEESEEDSSSGSVSNVINTKKSDKRVRISSLGGHLTLSKLQVGEVVTAINKKKIGPSYNAQRCTDLLNKFLDTGDGIVSVQTGNDEGEDTVVQVTIIKPDPSMSCKDLGLCALC